MSPKDGCGASRVRSLLAIGADGAFEPGTYEVSTLWIVLSTVLNPAEDPRPTVRTEAVGNMEAMSNARQPAWIALAIPFSGAAGVLAGARGRAGR